jgi:hypothetical protein
MPTSWRDPAHVFSELSSCASTGGADFSPDLLYAHGMTRRGRPFLLAMLSAAALFAGPAVASAQEATTTGMTCAAARQVVTQQGAAVLRTSASTFDRFVNSRAYCMVTELTEPAFVPTSDAPQCFVGYRCREPVSPPN